LKKAEKGEARIILQLWPVERRDDSHRVRKPQRTGYIGLHRRSCSRSERDDGHARQLLAQTVQLAVLWPVVAGQG
jgi:hypothetical protein